MREEDYSYVHRKKEKIALVGCQTLLIARRPVQPLVGRRPTAPAVTTRPTLTWAATRRSAAATQRSCQGDMRYAPPHCTDHRPMSRPALPHAPTAQAPVLTLPQRERPPETLAPSRAIGARAPAPRSGTSRRPGRPGRPARPAR